MRNPGVIIVCGGRDYTDRAAVFAALDRAHAKRPLVAVVHGAATGADALADEWAKARGVTRFPCPADWKLDGRAAGPKRNQFMLDCFQPFGVVAFPGGAGTADLVRRARAAGVPVWEPCAIIPTSSKAPV